MGSASSGLAAGFVLKGGFIMNTKNFLKQSLKMLLSIIQLPIGLAIFIMGKSNKGQEVINIKFNCGYYFIQITPRLSKNYSNGALLISAYLFFLARYFYICDERQKSVAKQILIEKLENNRETRGDISTKLFDGIYATLTEKEQMAISKVFKLGTLPFVYSENEAPRYSLAKYDFTVKIGNRIYTLFNMSYGFDTILLPMIVGIFNEYVFDHLENQIQRDRFDDIVMTALRIFDKIGYNSLPNLEFVVDKILKKNNVILSINHEKPVDTELVPDSSLDELEREERRLVRRKQAKKNMEIIIQPLHASIKEEKILSPIKDDSNKATQKNNDYDQKHPEVLIKWLRDSEQIPEEGESVDEFIKRTGWTLEEENRQRKTSGSSPLKSVDEYKRRFVEKVD